MEAWDSSELEDMLGEGPSGLQGSGSLGGEVLAPVGGVARSSQSSAGGAPAGGSPAKRGKTSDGSSGKRGKK